jgi:hypothetical protein
MLENDYLVKHKSHFEGEKIPVKNTWRKVAKLGGFWYAVTRPMCFEIVDLF